MTITKNDFFTANNFKTLQDIDKKYPEWKDFCMEIVNQMDDKFGVTMLSETSTEIKQLGFIDNVMGQRAQIEGLQEGKLYLIKMHIIADEQGEQILEQELYNTEVDLGKSLIVTYSSAERIDGIERGVITLQSDDTYNVGDTLLLLEEAIPNEDGKDSRYDYNGDLYEVIKVEGEKIYLDKSEVLFKETKSLYLYKKAK